MRRQRLSALMAAVLLMGSRLVFMPNAHAHEDEKEYQGGEKHERMVHHKQDFYKKLGVSEEQQNQLKNHREKQRAQMEALAGQIKAKREEIRQEIEKKDYDAARVRQIHGELKALKNQAEDARLEGILQVRQILTPEQFQKFMELKKEGHGKIKWEKGKRFEKKDTE